MSKITLEAGRNYTLKEVVELELIPGINTYSVAYLLVTEKGPDGQTLATANTSRTIKPNTEKVRPGAKRMGKIYVTAEDLSEYLTLNEIENEII